MSAHHCIWEHKPHWELNRIFKCPGCHQRWRTNYPGEGCPAAKMTGRCWIKIETPPEELIAELLVVTTLTREQIEELLGHLNHRQLLGFGPFLQMPELYMIIKTAISALKL